MPLLAMLQNWRHTQMHEVVINPLVSRQAIQSMLGLRGLCSVVAASSSIMSRRLGRRRIVSTSRRAGCCTALCGRLFRHGRGAVTRRLIPTV